MTENYEKIIFTSLDKLPPDPQKREMIIMRIDEAIDSLNEVHQRMIKGVYGIRQNIENIYDIGENYGYSHEESLEQLSEALRQMRIKLSDI